MSEAATLAIVDELLANKKFEWDDEKLEDEICAEEEVSDLERMLVDNFVETSVELRGRMLTDPPEKLLA